MTFEEKKKLATQLEIKVFGSSITDFSEENVDEILSTMLTILRQRAKIEWEQKQYEELQQKQLQLWCTKHDFPMEALQEIQDEVEV